MTERARSGVAALADAPVSPKRAAWAMTAVLIAVAPLGWGAAELVYDTANARPAVLASLRRAADPVMPGAPSRERPRGAVLLIVDGLRADEARRLGSWRALARDRRAVRGIVEVPLPSLSAPFQHALFTGVPQNGTGVRTNRFPGPPRLDTLIDRVHAIGGRVTWILEADGGMSELFGRRDDRIAAGPDALGRPLAAELAGLREGRGALLTVIHVLAVDSTAHAAGTRSPGHAAALRIADRVIWRTASAAAAADVALVVVADHGHLRAGGHGGDEPEVVRAPLLVRAPAIRPRRAERREVELTPAMLTAALARWSGIDPPRSATAVLPDTLADLEAESGGAADDVEDVRGRATRARAGMLEQGVQFERSRLATRRLWMFPLAGLLIACMLGAIKRGFAGLDAGTLLTPATYFTGVLAMHDTLLERPLSMSAFDDLNEHGPRLFWLGAAAALVAIGVGVAAWRRRPDLASGKAALAERMRRSTAACGLAVVGALLLSLAWCGGALGPWPLGAFAFYAPMLAGTTMIGACATCSAVMAVAAALTPPGTPPPPPSP